MWNCRKQKAVSRRQKAEGRGVQRVLFSCLLPIGFCLLVSAFCLLLSGCRRDMQDQPKAIAYRENSFYKDGTGSRPLVDGTVPRGYLREDRAFFLGKKATAQTTPALPQSPTAQTSANS